MQNFDELKICSQVVEDASQAASWFRAGLRADIKNELLRQPIYSVEDVSQAALNAEEYINNQNSKKNRLQIGEVVAKKNSDEYSEALQCGEDGHMAHQCQRRNNLHMGKAQDDEKQQVEDTKENSYDFGVYMPDDLEDDEDNSHLSFVRCILTAPKTRRAGVTTTELPCSYKIATSALQNSRSSFLQQGENDEEQEEAIQ
ncbi:hypothetical protein SLEP1_g52829 [Rubroshorea leprosula]|uniref:CCHC-type domain-containing protein n=1 Tax=Rubroshorea leprosula TaxID=152421 RepID=A0AAV5M7N4_9ROSI|nr:hypothetical protein SLEP1_g52829 [Rubroshorea leprosula]